jgi:hypothetical protein
VGPYTQVPERAYGVTDDPALALTGPTQVVAASASYGGSHQVASGTGAQVSFAIPEHYDVALYARPGPDGGVAAVVLDGVEIGSVSFYAAQSRPSTAVWVHRFNSDKGTGLLKFVLRSAGAGGGTALTFDALASTESVFHGA